ncbi:MAG: hypothetical protein KDA21_00655 [Phycisphaerales bacterium]|nr:hypothetical protein [Phycisphaerales bacterium]
MKQDQTFGGHVGPGLNLDPAAYDEVCKRIEKTFVRFSTLTIITWIAVLSAITAPLLLRLLEWLGVPRGIAVYVMIAIVAVTSCLGAGFFFHRCRRRRVRCALRECGYPVCQRCGYVMTGLPRHTPCPECGHQPASTGRST